MAKANRRRSASSDAQERGRVPENFDLARAKLPNRQVRRHSERKIQCLAASLERFGPVVPIVLDADENVVCGVARVLAARRLGLKTLPAIRVMHLSREELEVYRVADNRLAELGAWDEEALRDVFVLAEDLDIGFDALGFEVAEADLILYPGTMGGEETPSDPPSDSLLQLGDKFEIDGHEVFCGDALDPSAISQICVPGEVAAIITDPPYNVPVNGHVLCRNGRRHSEFAMASGEMSDEQFVAFLEQGLEIAKAAASPGALVYFFIDWRSVRLLLTAAHEIGLELINIAVFVKSNSGMGSFYRSQHELVGVFRKPGAQHRNNVQLGRFGRNRTNVWEYAGANAFGRTRDSDLAMHPTVKPTALIADVILDCTKRKDLVLDLFGGSGTTLIAAQRTGRFARIIEISPGYVETMLRRYQREFDRAAIHVETGLTFEDLIERRRSTGQQRSDVQAKPQSPRRRPRPRPNGEH
ncbi:MAG: DNA methyltransferase [Hyphomonadaceae bacterium]